MSKEDTSKAHEKQERRSAWLSAGGGFSSSVAPEKSGDKHVGTFAPKGTGGRIVTGPAQVDTSAEDERA